MGFIQSNKLKKSGDPIEVHFRTGYYNKNFKKFFQKLHWLTFYPTISSKREWAFLAEFPLHLVNPFKPQGIDSSFYIIQGGCTTKTGDMY